MDTFNMIAGSCSILSLVGSAIAAWKAWSASKAAETARDATLIRTLVDELQLACSRGEQLVDFLKQSRYSEASLRVDELTWSLSELTRRRSPHLLTSHQNTLLTSRYQLQTIVEAIAWGGEKRDSIDEEQIMKVARQVAMGLREILGDVRSHIDQGEK